MLSYLMVKRVDAGLVVIFLSLLSFHIIHGQSADLSVNGSIVIDNPATIYRRGDNVTFTFNVTFSVPNGLDMLNVSVWSPTLQFSESNVQWTLNGLDIDPGTGSEPQFDSASPEVIDDDIDSEDVYRLSIGVMKINVTSWRLDGHFAMTVKDDVGPGHRVQSFINLAVPLQDSNSTSACVVPSMYRYTPPLQAELIEPDSLIIGIMKTKLINVSLTLNEDNAAPLVEIISPYENISREVKLTIIDVKVNDTYGLEPDVVQDVSQTEPELRSTFMTYQRNIGSVRLPLLKNEAGMNESGLTAMFLLRLEDYTELEDGDNLTVGAGVKFGNSMILASDVTFVVDAPDAGSRSPDLKLSTTTSLICTGEDRNDIDLVMSISHSTTSTATAYDLQLNVFPMPSITFQFSVTISPVDQPFVFNISDYIRITLGRLTFSDPAKVTMKMRVQMNESFIRDTTNVIIPVELIYNDRWNNSIDRVTPMNYFNIKLNKKCADRYTWTTDATCTCDFDVTRSDCGCCMDHDLFNITQCGPDNPGVCAPTRKPWLCWQHIHDFLSHSKLQGFSGDHYECDASQKYRYRSNSETSCYRRSSDGFRGVHPMVAVILGKDLSSYTLYGVSSKGYAYILSQDTGKSWCTIRESDFLRAAASASYTPADLF